MRMCFMGTKTEKEEEEDRIKRQEPREPRLSSTERAKPVYCTTNAPFPSHNNSRSEINHSPYNRHAQKHHQKHRPSKEQHHLHPDRLLASRSFLLFDTSDAGGGEGEVTLLCKLGNACAGVGWVEQLLLFARVGVGLQLDEGGELVFGPLFDLVRRASCQFCA